ncbi:MAG: ATP-grasp domain-containing protein, partial [Anaerolineales bacterium]|nr:ATP-grasp domain-containing protein [Anaerolineales bacterium]
MFQKILVANRGEIAVRIVRTCREMGIAALALYAPADAQALHVRLADECAALPGPDGFMDGAALLRLAVARGADAIHPGYGFLAEEADFVQACAAAGVTVIGPPAGVLAGVRDKLGALARVRAAGFATVATSPMTFDVGDEAALAQAADELAYPLVVKACRGGRGPGARLVRRAADLLPAMRRAQAEARAVYSSQQVYLEQAILPAHQVAVQVLGDAAGAIIHLGAREGSVQLGNRKLVEEQPAPGLTAVQQEKLCETAVAIARLFGYQNAGTVEFLVDEAGQCYFTEIKARIQVEHTLTEMVTRIDLVQAQIELAAGAPLAWTQAAVQPRGWAMMCRIKAEDPERGYLPSPGGVDHLRLPGGPEIRVDTYVYCGSEVPAAYDPLIATVCVWGAERASCLARLRRALEDFKLVGLPTNLPLLQQVLRTAGFVDGRYTTELLARP